MCFSTPKVTPPPVPTKPDPNQVAAQAQDEERKRQAAAFGRQATVLTGSRGASDFGQGVAPTATLLGRAGAI